MGKAYWNSRSSHTPHHSRPFSVSGVANPAPHEAYPHPKPLLLRPNSPFVRLKRLMANLEGSTFIALPLDENTPYPETFRLGCSR